MGKRGGGFKGHQGALAKSPPLGLKALNKHQLPKQKGRINEPALLKLKFELGVGFNVQNLAALVHAGLQVNVVWTAQFA